MQKRKYFKKNNRISIRENSYITYILLIILIIVTSVSAVAYAASSILETYEPQISEAYSSVKPLLDKAKQTNNEVDYISACEAALKVDVSSSGLPAEVQAEFRNYLYNSLVAYNLQRYNKTNEKKYFNDAYKWAKTAVNEKTDYIDTIKSDIYCAYKSKEHKELVKAYDLLCATDKTKAEEFYPEYKEMLNKLPTNWKESYAQYAENYRQKYGATPGQSMLQGAGMGWQAGSGTLRTINVMQTPTGAIIQSY